MDSIQNRIQSDIDIIRRLTKSELKPKLKSLGLSTHGCVQESRSRYHSEMTLGYGDDCIENNSEEDT